MLLLSRKRNQKIIINEDIVIEIKSITRNNVRLGITAPSKYTILRDELSKNDITTDCDEAIVPHIIKQPTQS